jgi:ribosomal protein L16/L10AE
MGKGKGAIVGWHMLIPAGQVLFELYEPGMNMARLRYLARILSFRISSRFQAIKLY